jgi:hypothetical protein
MALNCIAPIYANEVQIPDPLEWYKTATDQQKDIAGLIYAEASGLRTREQEPDLSKLGKLPADIALGSQLDKQMAYSHIAMTVLCREHLNSPKIPTTRVAFTDVEMENKFVLNSAQLAAQATVEIIDYYNSLEEPLKTGICEDNRFFWVECFDVDYDDEGKHTLRTTYTHSAKAKWILDLKAKHALYEEYIAANPNYYLDGVPEDRYPQITSYPYGIAGDDTRYVFYVPGKDRGYCELFRPMVYVR